MKPLRFASVENLGSDLFSLRMEVEHDILRGSRQQPQDIVFGRLYPEAHIKKSLITKGGLIYTILVQGTLIHLPAAGNRLTPPGNLLRHMALKADAYCRPATQTENLRGLFIR
jgi:hypothetical protein